MKVAKRLSGTKETLASCSSPVRPAPDNPLLPQGPAPCGRRWGEAGERGQTHHQDPAESLHVFDQAQDGAGHHSHELQTGREQGPCSSWSHRGGPSPAHRPAPSKAGEFAPTRTAVQAPQGHMSTATHIHTCTDVPMYTHTCTHSCIRAASHPYTVTVHTHPNTHIHPPTSRHLQPPSFSGVWAPSPCGEAPGAGQTTLPANPLRLGLAPHWSGGVQVSP